MAQDLPDLFAAAAERDMTGKPLAERMRPRTLDELVGQEHVLGPGTLLRKAIESDNVPSLLLWGPPGCGKTTLAQVIALATKSELVQMSATEAGIKDIREVVARAKELRAQQRKRTILFIDEIQRFNKGQQDSLLPHVERGVITLLGATTENPSFEVNAALLSRCRVFALRPLEETDLHSMMMRALTDKKRGFGDSGIVASPEFLEHVAHHASGDGRRALGALEVAVARAQSEGRDKLTAIDAEVALQQ
jgi:putative ATPase